MSSVINATKNPYLFCFDASDEPDEPIIVSTVGLIALELNTSELGSLTSLLIFSIVSTLVPTLGALSAGILLPTANANKKDQQSVQSSLYRFFSRLDSFLV